MEERNIITNITNAKNDLLVRRTRMAGRILMSRCDVKAVRALVSKQGTTKKSNFRKRVQQVIGKNTQYGPDWEQLVENPKPEPREEPKKAGPRGNPGANGSLHVPVK